MREVCKACSTRGRIKKILHYFNTDLKLRVYFGVVRVSWKFVLKSLIKKQVVVLELCRPNLAYSYNPEAGCCGKGNELSDFIIGGKFVVQLSDYSIFKKKHCSVVLMIT